jgi:hypothetical protein
MWTIANPCSQTEMIDVIEKRTGRDVSWIDVKPDRCIVKFFDSERYDNFVCDMYNVQIYGCTSIIQL